jgi:RHS repeat-associated protein
VIDGQNRRVGKKANGLLVEGLVYRSQLQPAVWLNGDGSVRATFVYGLHPNVPEYMVQGGTTYRLLTDQVGSVRLVVNVSTGVVAERLDYDEFGNALSDSAPGFQPFGFAGGLRGLDTGLTRFGARDYDPVAGRWTARDPLLFEGRQLNLYSYVGEDPVNRLDPTGLSWLVYDPNTHTTTFYGRDGTPLGEWPSGNNVMPGRSVYPYPPLDPGFAPGGRAYEFDYYMAHPESDATGPYGSNGNFVFKVPGHLGIGFHSGRRGPNSPTNGCYRSTNEATATVLNATCGDLSPEDCEKRSLKGLPLPGSDPLEYLYVLPYNSFP